MLRLPCRQLGEGGDCGAAEETRKSAQLKQSRTIAKSEAMIIELKSSLKSRNDAPLNPAPSTATAPRTPTVRIRDPGSENAAQASRIAARESKIPTPTWKAGKPARNGTGSSLRSPSIGQRSLPG